MNHKPGIMHQIDRFHKVRRFPDSYFCSIHKNTKHNNVHQSDSDDLLLTDMGKDSSNVFDLFVNLNLLINYLENQFCLYM